MRINLFYPAVVVIGIALVFLFRPPAEVDLSFYGFAESNETAVNYNYPVVIKSILVKPGQLVKAGEPLLEVNRQQAKEQMPDQAFRIRELNAEERLWRQRKQDQLAEMRQRHADRDAVFAAEINELESELAYSRSLLKDLKSLNINPEAYDPLAQKIARIKEERARTQVQSEEQEQSLERELKLGTNPYRAQTDRLRAEARFDSSQLVQAFTVTAPADGLIGTVSVKEDEHVPSYETLLSFYEPHSSLVSGYLHEDQTSEVKLGDLFQVYSLKNPELSYEGSVTGLGSRIVSIPTRLRKLPDFETYGREVIVEIPADNSFLQKEKVGLRKLPGKSSVK